MSREYLRRTADATIDELTFEHGAVFVTGPRACGKTTTAARRAASIARLDVPAQRAQFVSDPDAALQRLARPALLDEWQFAPDVLSAVKRSIDAGSGDFLITGSSRSHRSPELWPGTGRLARVRMFGLTEAEVERRPGIDPVDRLLDEQLPTPATPLSLPDYIDRAVGGGMPEPRLRDLDRGRWYSDYLDHLVDRDLAPAGFEADDDRLRRYVDALAENLAGTPADATLYGAAGINARTARRYDGLLEDLGLLDRVPAWTSNRLSRLSSRHKMYLTDTGLAAAALGVDARDVLSDGNLFGRAVDAFVAAQIRPSLASRRSRARLHHLRTSDGRHEVDLIIDLGYRGLIAIEVKAAAAVTATDARHLAWLRDALGDRFLRGVVLHTGPDAFPLDDRIVAAPISTLWA